MSLKLVLLCIRLQSARLTYLRSAQLELDGQLKLSTSCSALVLEYTLLFTTRFQACKKHLHALVSSFEVDPRKESHKSEGRGYPGGVEKGFCTRVYGFEFRHLRPIWEVGADLQNGNHQEVHAIQHFPNGFLLVSRSTHQA